MIAGLVNFERQGAEELNADGPLSFWYLEAEVDRSALFAIWRKSDKANLMGPRLCRREMQATQDRDHGARRRLVRFDIEVLNTKPEDVERAVRPRNHLLASEERTNLHTCTPKCLYNVPKEVNPVDARTAEALELAVSIENLGDWAAAARKAAQKLAEAAEAMEEARRLLDSLPDLKVTAGAAG